MACAVAPQTSPACVTWAGHRTCPLPRLPQDPPPPAVPGTVAATSTATATSGGLASAMSARVSSPHPELLGTGLKGASLGLLFSFVCVGFGIPSPSSESLCPIACSLPQTGFGATHLSGRPQHSLLGFAVAPQSGFQLPSFEPGGVGEGRAPSHPFPDSASWLLGPPQTGPGGNTANGAGRAALVTPQAQEAAGPASATGMGTHAEATATTSAGSASARTTLRAPTASSAPLATMGTPGEPGASQAGQGGVRDVVG